MTPTDLTLYRKRRLMRRAIERGPVFTVAAFADGVFTVAGVGISPESLRAIAEDLIECAVECLNEAYRRDGDTDQYPRLMALLYHTGRARVSAVNQDQERDHPSTYAWMRRCMGEPVQDAITRLEEAARGKATTDQPD